MFCEDHEGQLQLSPLCSLLEVIANTTTVVVQHWGCRPAWPQAVCAVHMQEALLHAAC